MYYSGFPFNEYSEVSSISSDLRYFQIVKSDVTFSKAIYEGILRNKVDIVIYQEADWEDCDLENYHTERYPDTAYATENKIGNDTYRIVTVFKGKVTGYQIFKYDKLWRPKIEQIFDQDHLLLEYKNMIYNDDLRRVPNQEKSFYSSWHINEENYE